MQQSVEEGAHGGIVAEQLAPVVDGAVGCHDGADALVATHDDFEQVLSGGVRQLAHAEVVDDEQGHGADLLHEVLPRTVEGRIGELFDQGVGFLVEHFVAVVNRSEADGLREVALAGPRRPEKQAVLALQQEAPRREFEDQLLVHLRIEGEVEVVECAAPVAEVGLLDAAFDKSVTAPVQFVMHQAIQEVEVRQAFGLGLQNARLQGRGHPRKAELAKGAIEFGLVHGLLARSCDG